MRAQSRYAKSGDVHIAYQVTGDGPLDLVLVPGFVSHLEYFWEELGAARFLERVGPLCRFIRFDKRGTGLSDRVAEVPSLEQRMDDVRAVMDAVGSERAALLGWSEGGPMPCLFAATHPQRTSALLALSVHTRDGWMLLRVALPRWPVLSGDLVRALATPPAARRARSRVGA